MNAQLLYHPESISHPGMMLAEKLDEIEMTSKEFAVLINTPVKIINQILNGEGVITPVLAERFEKVLGIPVKLWLKHDQAYQKCKAR